MDALMELTMARAVSLGEALHKNGNDGKVRSAVRSLTRRAFPNED